MKLRLLEKAIKFKYLKYLLKKSNSSLSVYFLVNNRKEFLKSIAREKGHYMQIPSRYLSLLLDRSSKLKWKWLNIFSGVIYLWVNFEYDFNPNKIKPLLKINNNFIILGGFVRNIYLSRSSWNWFFEQLKFYPVSNWQNYRNQSLHFFVVQIFKYLYLFLIFHYKLMNLTIKRIETV